jgi:hypothetical protein
MSVGVMKDLKLKLGELDFLLLLLIEKARAKSMSVVYYESRM